MNGAIKPRSTRARLAVWLVLVLLPPMVVGWWMERRWRQHAAADAAGAARRAAGIAAVLHEDLIRDSHRWLLRLSRAVSAVPGDPSAVGALLSAHLENSPDYLNAGVLDAHGGLVASAQPLPDPYAIGEHPLFQRAIQTGTFAIGDYEVDGATGHGRVMLASPHRDGAGQLRHLAFVVVEIGWLREVSSQAGFPAGSVVALLDGRGAFLLHEPEPLRWSGRPAPAALTTGSEDLSEIGPEHDGVPRLFGRQAVSGHPDGLYVAVGIPKVSEPDRGQITFMVVGYGLALVMAVALAVTGTEVYYLRPLRRIVETADRLRRGELGARTGLVGEGEELDQLALTFDEMAAELERRERALMQQHALVERQARRFHALVENSSDGVILVDPDARIVYASPSTSRVMGLAVDRLVGCDAFERVHPDDCDRLRDIFVQVLATPSMFQACSFRAQHGNGTWRNIGAVLTNMCDEPSVGAVVANYRDITDRVRSEEALLRAHDELEGRVHERTAELLSANRALEAEIEERARVQSAHRILSLAIEQTADCVMVAGRDGIIEYVNPAFEVLTGYSRQEAVGARTSLVKSGKHSAPFYQRMWERILEGEVFRAVFINRTKDGRLYYEDQTITPIRGSDGAVTHFVSTGRDITHRKRTEEALRRLNEQLEHEAKRIASALHDEAGRFLTTAHITLADVARSLPPDTGERLREVRDNLDQVEEQLRRLSHELRPRILDDLGLLEALKFLADGVSLRTGVAVSVLASIDGRYPQLVETALYRMVQEALTNIAKHAHATRATVVIEEENRQVRCAIRDNGRGFDVGTLHRAGECGLGLVGIQDRLEAVGGTLEIVSMPGGGTELRATVPLEAV